MSMVADIFGQLSGNAPLVKVPQTRGRNLARVSSGASGRAESGPGCMQV